MPRVLWLLLYESAGRRSRVSKTKLANPPCAGYGYPEERLQRTARLREADIQGWIESDVMADEEQRDQPKKCCITYEKRRTSFPVLFHFERTTQK